MTDEATVTFDKQFPFQIMPAMTLAQYHELKEDIRQKGVLQAIELDEEGRIIDGHHRFKAFQELIDLNGQNVQLDFGGTSKPWAWSQATHPSRVIRRSTSG